MVTHPEDPCLGARSVFRRDTAQVIVLEEMDAPQELAELSDRLARFAADTDPRGPFASLIAVFRSSSSGTGVVRRSAGHGERKFESLLWKVLQGLHDEDAEG